MPCGYTAAMAYTWVLPRTARGGLPQATHFKSGVLLKLNGYIEASEQARQRRAAETLFEESPGTIGQDSC